MKIRMNTSLIGIAALALVPLLWTSAPAAKGAGAVSVAAPVRLTESGDNLKPFVAIRPSGGVYVAWAQKNGEKSSVLFARSRDGVHLETGTRVSLIGMHLDLGAENGPNVAVDSKGAVYVVWVAGSSAAPKAEKPTASAAGTAAKTHGGHPPRPGNLNIWLARSEDDGASFSTPVRVNDDLDGAEHRFPTIVADTQGGICVTWLDKRKKSVEGEEMARVFFARSSDGGRTFCANVDATGGQVYPICHCCRVGVACDANGGLSIAFRNDIDDLRDMFLIRSQDGGHSFSTPAPLERTGWKLPNCPMDGPSLGIDPSGGVHAAWMSGANIPGIPVSRKIQADDPKVLYNCIGPGSATVPTPIILGTGHHPRVAVGRSGDTFVVWHDTSIRLARVGAGEHPATQVLALTAAKGAPSYPSIALAPEGTLYCAWQQLMPDDSVQIYLSRVPETAFAPKP